MEKSARKAKANNLDQIEKIEKSLSRSVKNSEAAKLRAKNKQKRTPKEHRRTRHPIAVSLFFASLVTTLLILLSNYYFGSILDFLKNASTDKTTETSQTEGEPEPEKEKLSFGENPIIIYISGSDSRTSVHDATARSDVNIIAVVNPTTGKILLVNTPRDYYVQLHGTTGLRDKLTHAGTYGIDMSKQTLEDLLGIKVDYTVKVGFDALETVVDAIGGIDIYSDQNLSLKSGTCRFSANTTTHVNGTCALAFSRERKSYTTGDRHRGENQQQVISKIIEKVTSPAYLLKFPEILRAADGLFETSFSYQEILDILKFQLLSGSNWQTESIALDGTGSMQPTYSIPGQSLYVMIPNEASIAAAKEKIIQSLKTADELKAEEEVRRAAEEAKKAAEEAQKAETESAGE